MLFVSAGAIRRWGSSIALPPAAAVVVAPLGMVAVLVDGLPALPQPHALAVHIGISVVAISIVAIKFVLPLMVSLALTSKPPGPFASLAWVAAVAASTSAVISGSCNLLPQSHHPGWLGLTALVVTWFSIEIIGTLAIPALLQARAGPPVDTIPKEQPPISTDEVPNSSNRGDVDRQAAKKIVAASASSPAPAREILFGLQEIAASPSGADPHKIWLRPDGWLRATHRELADAFGMPRSTMVRRLDQLKRDGEIEVVSTRVETLIKLIRNT